MDFQGLPLFSSTGASAEKRKLDVAADMQQPAVKAPPPTPTPPPSFPMQTPRLNNISQDYSTFQFKAAQQPKAINQPPVSPSPSPAPPALFLSAGLQAIHANLERRLAQVGGFFFGNRRETPREEEKHQRDLNDSLVFDFLGERKVEQSHQSNLGEGSN